MRILIAADTYYPHVNGASIAIQRMAFYLRQRSHDILVIAPSLTSRSEFFTYDGIRIFGVRSLPIIIYKGFRFTPPILIKRTIRKIFKDFNPDILQIQGHFYICRNAMVVAKELNLPVIGTNHFMPENLLHYFRLPKFLENLLKRCLWYQFRKVFSKLDLITTPTRAAADLLRNNGFKKLVIPISNGIDLEKFNSTQSGDYLKEKFNIPNKPILLYTGRIDKEKNIDVILKALLVVLRKIDIYFVVGGGGAFKKNLENLVKQIKISESVAFIGYLSNEDLHNVYRIADCFIIASTAELQSLVTMEAMASGLPVIAANALALPELVKHGENGYLFEPGDSSGVAEAIIQIFSDGNLRHKMAQKSLELIKTHDINQVIKRFETLYKQLIQKNNAKYYPKI